MGRIRITADHAVLIICIVLLILALEAQVSRAAPYLDPMNGDIHSTMQGATATSAGRAGGVPAPASADRLRFLRGDGLWGDPASTTTNNANAIGNNTKLLIHADSNLTDSVGSHTLSKSANVTYATDTKKFGTASLMAYAISGHNFFATDTHADFNIAANDFSFDFWINSQSATIPTIEFYNGATTYLHLGMRESNQIVLTSHKNNTTYNAAYVPMDNGVWTHLAVAKVGKTVTIYKNAAVHASIVLAAADEFDTPATANIRMISNDGSYHVYIDEFRYSNGTANAPQAIPATAYANENGLLGYDQFSSLSAIIAWLQGKVGNTSEKVHTHGITAITGSETHALAFILPSDPDNDALHFQVQLSSTANFSTTLVDWDSRATAQGVTGCVIFDGSAWIAYPSGGAGAAYYGKRAAYLYTSSTVSRGTLYYLRFRVHDGTSWSDWTGEVRTW